MAFPNKPNKSSTGLDCAGLGTWLILLVAVLAVKLLKLSCGLCVVDGEASSSRSNKFSALTPT